MEDLPKRVASPKVLPWYRVYCVLMGCLYAVCAVLGVVVILFPHQLDIKDVPAEFSFVYGVVLLGIGVILCLAFGISFFLPRARWAWIYHLVLICLGMTSCCCLPVCIPLLIFWINRETRDYFENTEERPWQEPELFR